MSTHDGIIDFP